MVVVMIATAAGNTHELFASRRCKSASATGATGLNLQVSYNTKSAKVKAARLDHRCLQDPLRPWGALQVLHGTLDLEILSGVFLFCKKEAG
ncbi:hypothetical protein [Geotalea toluenoxydans]|uniref:hypothetical protein n=1 Tax=Geotalea toluenoxydans TaxID=421624 RepID=UPI000AFD0866|nr:hypothetical protein [Geotalea toluenoxydans]